MYIFKCYLLVYWSDIYSIPPTPPPMTTAIDNLNEETQSNSSRSTLLSAATEADRIRNFGYSAETHKVQTKDGYILGIFRITNATVRGHQKPQPIALMMHGLVSSSDAWILGGPADALPFNLADSGYDVWLGNYRGNPYSNRHISLSSNDRRFWQYTLDDVSSKDLPATIDYILQLTHQNSLHYFGHSQGSAIMFALLSTQPKYNQKLKTSHMFAPIAFMSHARSKPIHLAAPLFGTYSNLDAVYGDMPFLQNPLLRKVLGINKCRSPFTHRCLCDFWLNLSLGYSTHIPQSIYSEIFNTHPASCSTHQFIHLVQAYVSGHFRPYDHGIVGNLRRYNQTTPPDYQVANIKPRFPLNLYYSDNDVLSAREDVEHLIRILGKRCLPHFINEKNFAHADFLWSSNVKAVLNNGILRQMNKVEHLLQQENKS
ncbi:lipase 3-like [Musca domestica]|uniref:Lipase n=1 Tax=Musca domestica TaxID=7370 RepID=A0A1I8NAB5_MUSDO|nr:lipase 3-like [Musca domestica]